MIRPGRSLRDEHDHGGDRQGEYQEPEGTGCPQPSRQHRAAILTIKDAFGSKTWHDPMKNNQEAAPQRRATSPSCRHSSTRTTASTSTTTAPSCSTARRG